MTWMGEEAPFGLPGEGVKVEKGGRRPRYYRKHMMMNVMACLSLFVMFYSILLCGEKYAR